MTSRKRTIFKVFAALLTTVALLFVALPLWFPWIARPALRRFGVNYAKHERVGYSRLALVDLVFTNDTILFKAGRMETFVPPAWLWHRQLRHTNELFVNVMNWNVELRPRAAGERTGRARGQASVYEILDGIEKKLPIVQSWSPRAMATNGVVRASTNEIEFPQISWQNNRLRMEANNRRFGQGLHFDAAFPVDSTWRLAFALQPLSLSGLLLLTKQSELAQISGDFAWRTNKLLFQTRFPPQARWPSEAIVTSESFRIPATDLKLSGYSDVSGSLSARWQTNQFSLDLKAQAEPEGERWPPLEVTLRARGRTNSMTIDEFRATTPFLNALLSPGTELSFDGQLLSPASTLRFEAALDQQEWMALSGKARGEFQFRPGPRKFPDTTFEISGDNLSGFGMRVKDFTSNGSLEWPQIDIHNAAAHLEEETTVQASASLNMQSRYLSHGTIRLTSSGNLDLLPRGYSLERLSAQADLQGGLDDLTHSLRLEASNFRLPKIKPFSASLTSRGEKLRLDQFHANIAAGASKLQLSASAQFVANRLELDLATLTLTTAEERLLALAQPVHLTAERPPHGTAGTYWLVRCGQFDWRGADRAVQLSGKVRWPIEGNCSASLHGLAANLFQDFLAFELPKLAINEFQLLGGWTNGPATFQLKLDSTLTATNALPFSVQVNASAQTNSLVLDRFAVSDGTNAILSGTGFLPITLNPVRTGAVLRVETREPIDFLATTQPNPNFWAQVSKWTRVTLQQPSIDLAISGTLQAPKGRIGMSVASFDLPTRDAQRKLPRFDRLDADIEIVPNRLQVHALRVFVEDQPIRAMGEVPFDNDFSARLKDVVDLKKATGHVQIDHARLAPFAPFFPKIISPQGELTLDLTVKPGANLDGSLWITNAATRPVMTLGTVQDISALIRFAGHSLQVENFSGFFSGERLVFSGAVDFAERDPETDLPPFNFRIRGNNIPLARRPELILRSDLDLVVSNLTNKVPVVGGVVQLRDSFYLADLKLLIPGRVAAPSRRPPYFSVEAEPLASWRLAMQVSGDRFLHVRTPFFRGAISANLNVQGTLREPAAIGSVRINEGLVQFPFANLRVDQGLVTLTSENPYRPQLQVNAAARTFGYEIKMDVTGSADEPLVQFSSVPALSSEQIVLMLTTGEMPGNQLTFSTQQRAGRMALFVGKGLLSKFAGEGSADRLMVRSGENVTETGKQTYQLEYKLSDDWSLIGEYDRFSAFNAGIKWKFYSK